LFLPFVVVPVVRCAFVVVSQPRRQHLHLPLRAVARSGGVGQVVSRRGDGGEVM
jgi:hypothetical protein